MGSGFIDWVKLLYRSPVARVLVNGSMSDIFPFSGSTRQGCPFSPLLFTLALKPLTKTIRNHHRLSGVILGDIEYEISLYADDVLLFFTNPESSIPVLISIISQFGQISRYKINYDKLEALPLGDFGDQAALVSFPFRWSTSGFTNFTPTLTSLKSDLNRSVVDG